ncbi:MAG TPA: cohesin domain-containing protein, partial [Bacteroidota bacterium]|nr:cohesin domain-containing protein [Bacteroidota bacterium]
MKRFFLLLLLIGIFTVPPLLMAGPVGIAVHDSTVASGATVFIPVRVDTTVTDSNVVSYQIDLSYSSSAILVDSVIISGTMTNGWLTTFRLYAGRITIAGSSGTPLTGKGILFYLRAKILITYSQNYGSITFNSATLNEGKPTTVTRNGSLTITASPIITVYPDNVVLTVGDAQQFSVSGGTAPFTWSTTNPSIATINSSGILTALHAGFCRVVAVDQNHVVDTSQQVEVRAYKLSIRDTSYFQGQTFLLPIYISDLSLVDIYSGTFTLTFNQSILQATGITFQVGTLLASYGAPVVKTTSSTISIAFAGTTRLNGVGNSVLMYIQFQVSNINPYSTSIQFSNFIMNETITGTNRDG